jgi:hypothetical protein
VWFQVSLFRSLVVIIGDGCCSSGWSFGALARRLSICLLKQVLLRQAFPGSDDGGARTAARLRLALVFVVVTTWSNDLIIIILLLLGLFVLLLLIINRSMELGKSALGARTDMATLARYTTGYRLNFCFTPLQLQPHR